MEEPKSLTRKNVKRTSNNGLRYSEVNALYAQKCSVMSNIDKVMRSVKVPHGRYSLTDRKKQLLVQTLHLTIGPSPESSLWPWSNVELHTSASFRFLKSYETFNTPSFKGIG